MRIPLKITLQEIGDAYNLTTLVENQGWIYMRIDKVMYGLKQSGIIANQELVRQMDPFGCHPVHTPGLRVYDNRKIIFSLVVDDFCVQYYSVEDADHFFNALKDKYLITVDMEVNVYIGIKMDWEYVNRTVTLSMPNYVSKTLHRFHHILMGSKDYSPNICAPIQYGKKIQYVEPLYS